MYYIEHYLVESWLVLSFVVLAVIIYVTIQLRETSKLSRDSKGLPDLALVVNSMRSVILVTTPWDASPVPCNCRCKLNMRKQVLAA